MAGNERPRDSNILRVWFCKKKRVLPGSKNKQKKHPIGSMLGDSINTAPTDYITLAFGVWA
jgi:hypothetical protein